MATIESLEALLAQSLQCLDSAAAELRERSELDLKRNLKRLGNAINDIWAFREEIHRLRPDLKPPFVSENASDPERYDRLQDRATAAHNLEESGNLEIASEAYEQLRLAAKRGYFCTVAEAGLFRTMKK
jgi:hypothetical protein